MLYLVSTQHTIEEEDTPALRSRVLKHLLQKPLALALILAEQVRRAHFDKSSAGLVRGCL